MGYKKSYQCWMVFVLGAVASMGLLSGCGSEETLDTARIPSVTVQCTAAGAENCVGNWIYVYWTTGSCSVSSLSTYSARSLTKVAVDECLGGMCTVAIPSTRLTSSVPWESLGGQAVTTLAAGSYRACVVIDSNGSGETNPNVGNAGDYIGESALTVLNASTAGPTISEFTVL